MSYRVRPITTADQAPWCAMRRAMGPEWLTDDFERLALEFFTTGRIQSLVHAVFVAESGDDLANRPLVGFAEVSLREYAEGCLSSPVGYLEGWFVHETVRGQGVGRRLVEACVDWARSHGWSELASDAELENRGSLEAHRALGFEGVADIRCFRMPIS